jgi:hypothetical protein
MNEPIVIAVVAAFTSILSGLVVHVFPKWLEYRRGGSEKGITDAEAESQRWKNFIEREKWRDAQITALSKRVDHLETSERRLKSYVDTCLAVFADNGITPPVLKDDVGWVQTRSRS